MAIKVNESGLRNVISLNGKAVSNLETAKALINSIQIPEKFSYSATLRNIPSQIEKIENNINGINDYIDKKIDKYKEAERKAQNAASGLSALLSGLGIGTGGTNNRTSVPANMMNNPDYEHYMKTQGKNTATNSPSLFPYSDAYLEQKYGDTAAKLRKSKSLASLANLVIGGVKGVSKAVENTIDGYKVGQANSISASNPDWDYFTGGNKNKVDEYARPYKQETMERVSKDYTQSWNNRLYNTEVGKKLDESAGKLFKSNGAATNFVSNLTYRGTLMATGKFPVGAGFLGYLSGKGEATQSYWSQADIQSQIKQGKNIDNIFEKGNTYGNIKGATQGASMAFQKATGARGKVDEVLNKAWKRILADGIAGGAETVAVAKADSIINGKSFKRTFEEKGGWKAVRISAASSSAISALGELARWGLGKAVSQNNSKADDILNGKTKKTIPMNLQFFANKKKEYMDLQTIEEIEKMYGATNDITRAETNALLKEAGKLIDSGELDGDQSFYRYMIDNIKGESNQFDEYASFDTFMKRLTIREAQSINSFTDGSTKIQEFLGEKVLEQNGTMTKEKMIDYINNIDSALEKGADLKDNQVFNRGMTWEQMKKWGFLDYDSLKASEGTTINCKNYISTGVTKEGAFYDREVLWRIKCDAGSNYGAYINEISKYSINTNEYEFLMKRGAQMRIDNVDRMDLIIDNPEHGVTYIDATILGFKPEKIDKNTNIKIIEPPKETILIE